MARRTYGENERTTVERDVEDREIVEAFVDELDGYSSAEEVLEGVEDAENIKATARYNLVHPYDGKNFSDHLIRGDDVTARVEFYVEPEKSETEVYTGHVSYDARDIFSPAAVVGMEDDSSGKNLIESGGEEVSAKSQMAQTD